MGCTSTSFKATLCITCLWLPNHLCCPWSHCPPFVLSSVISCLLCHLCVFYVILRHLCYRLSSYCVVFCPLCHNVSLCHILSRVLSSILWLYHTLSCCIVCIIVCPLIVSTFVLYVIYRPPCLILSSGLSSIVCYIHLLFSVYVCFSTLCVQPVILCVVFCHLCRLICLVRVPLSPQFLCPLFLVTSCFFITCPSLGYSHPCSLRSLSQLIKYIHLLSVVYAAGYNGVTESGKGGRHGQAGSLRVVPQRCHWTIAQMH